MLSTLSNNDTSILSHDQAPHLDSQLSGILGSGSSSCSGRRGGSWDGGKGGGVGSLEGGGRVGLGGIHGDDTVRTGEGFNVNGQS